MCPCDYSKLGCFFGGKTHSIKRDMLLAFLLLPCFLCGSLGTQYEVCYGGTFKFPFQFSPRTLTGNVYFSPKSGGGGRRLVYENGKAMEPRLQVTPTSLSLQHVTEKDSGEFSTPISGFYLERFKLKVLECAGEVQRYYHGTYRLNIPSQAEILEFSKIDHADLEILWNRTQIGGASRGRAKLNSWEMSELTQGDSGYYNFRKKDYTLISRTKLIVTEHLNNYQPKEDTHLTLRFPVTFTPWDITFKPMMDDSTPIRVMRSGRMSNNYGYSEEPHFEDRLSLDTGSLEITTVKVEDSGVFEFRDKDGFLVFVANLDVEEVHTPAYIYVIFFVAIVAALAICCCCIRRCCCKKSASKTNTPQMTPAAAPAPAPAVYYHGTNRPTGPSYSAAPPPATYSYQPVNPSPAPTPASVGPPAYNRVDIHPDPNPTQLQPPQAVGSTGHFVAPAPSLTPNNPTSDPDPKFEVKGLRFSSNLPLNSESTFANVYTSDKLNF
ncbi:uncharacterized protein wu:fc21g02 [Syngnathus acus]|uniref:uncharacterized protein wu:fc21g02 n=1 Tax=Syngnathus acus TaxID=161584 RepID=UPI00188622B1|nr:uncharacterized protein wu:fc21g02 [Syngnathus acus]